MRIQEVSKVGQIKEGDLLLLGKCGGVVFPMTVKEVLNAGAYDEEIILNKRRNIYFIMAMFLDGESWIKDAVIVPNGQMFDAGNTPNRWITQ